RDGLGERLGRHEQRLVLLGPVRHGQADVGQERARDQRDLLAAHELLGVLDGLGGLPLVVAEDDLDLATEDAALGVDLLRRHLDRLLVGAGEGRTDPAERVDLADLDRSLGGRPASHRERQQAGHYGDERAALHACLPFYSWPARQSGRGGLYGLDDAMVAGTATEHGGEPLADVGLARRRLDAQEVERRHQHSRRTEAALQAVMLAERLLQRMERAVGHQTLDRRELGAVGLHGQHQAGARGLAVDENRAGAADAVLAAHVGAGEPEVFAQEIHQQLARWAPALARAAVDGDPHGDVAHAFATVSARLIARPV